MESIQFWGKNNHKFCKCNVCGLIHFKCHLRVELDNLVIFLLFKIAVSKILVTSGGNSHDIQTTSEIVDLTVKGGNMCNNWPDFPIGVKGATGGIIGDNVIICGGWGIDECYRFTSEKATLVTHMSVGREDAASIVLNDNTLWVTGGFNSGNVASSTEYVTANGTILGPDFPMALYGHAMVAINKTCSMVIAGRNWFSVSPLTFFYDHSEGELMINGPSLMQARAHHAAGIVTDDVTDEHFAVVTGGGGGGESWLDSTEILQDGNWVEGKINDIISYLL